MQKRLVLQVAHAEMSEEGHGEMRRRDLEMISSPRCP